MYVCKFARCIIILNQELQFIYILTIKVNELHVHVVSANFYLGLKYMYQLEGGNIDFFLFDVNSGRYIMWTKLSAQKGANNVV